MKHRRKALIVAGTSLALVGGGLGAAYAVAGGGGDDGDATAAGPGADQARAAALAANPGGKANSVERDGENGATWEVEVTRADGNTVDVRLDANYKILVTEGDSGQ